MNQFPINIGNKIDFVVVDGFYAYPNAVRELALSLQYMGDERYFKGKRSVGKYLTDEIGRQFEILLNKKITKWDYEVNGCFQFCTAEDLLVYHMDSQQYAAAIYLTPGAPVECGTGFFKSKANGIRQCPTREGFSEEDANDLIGAAFSGGFLDKTNFELVDSVGNVFNRLVVWDAKLIHAASQYFGKTKESGRLFQMFFFDAE